MMGCWEYFVWDSHLSLVTSVLLRLKNPLGGRRSHDTRVVSAKASSERFLLSLRRSSSCGRDCADGLLEVVCMTIAFISRDLGACGPLTGQRNGVRSGCYAYATQLDFVTNNKHYLHAVSA
jgi:hypothetical protein